MPLSMRSLMRNYGYDEKNASVLSKDSAGTLRYVGISLNRLAGRWRSSLTYEKRGRAL